MPYPRRRAPIACEYCRHSRKARRPDNAGTAALLQRINELENRLRECQRNEAERSACSSSRSSTHEPTSCLGDDPPTSTEGDRNSDPFQVDDGVGQTGGSATGTPNAQIGVLPNPLTGMSGDNDPPIAPGVSTPQTSTLGLSPSIWAAQPLPTSNGLQLGSASVLNYGPSSIPTTDEGGYVIIPCGHHTTTSSLLSIEPARALVGYYPEGLFYDLEASREASPVIPGDMMSDDLGLLLSQVDLSQGTTDRLISGFFAFIQPQFPIIDRDLFPEVFERSKQDVSKHIYGPSLGMCLLVLALGALGSTDSPLSPDDNDSAGMPYFIIAQRILTTIWAGSFDDDLCQPTGMLLAAIYLCFKSRPLAAWKLAYMSSCNLQLLTQRTTSDYEKEHDDMLSRLCWTCFVIECDSLSEFHLPRTGIEMAIDRMNFPWPEGCNERDNVMFLALCSIRRLLNRIHNSVYRSNNKHDLSPMDTVDQMASLSRAQHALLALVSLEGILSELERQLDAWYISLPEIVKPDLCSTVPSDTQDAWLRLRYWSARHIISRPCLMYAITWCKKGEVQPEYVSRHVETCLDSSRNFIRTSIHVLTKQTYYSWMVLQALLSHSVLIVAAVSCSSMKHMVPEWRDLLQLAVEAVKPWSTRCSSAEVILLILQTLRHKVGSCHQLADAKARKSQHGGVRNDSCST